MKTLIIYESIHHGNTEKIGKIIGEALNGDIRKINDVNLNALNEYDLIGFGSGIYYGKLHKNILNFIDNLKIMSHKKAFVFSTSGQGRIKYNKLVEQKLKEKTLKLLVVLHVKAMIPLDHLNYLEELQRADLMIMILKKLKSLQKIF